MVNNFKLMNDYSRGRNISNMEELENDSQLPKVNVEEKKVYIKEKLKIIALL